MPVIASRRRTSPVARSLTHSSGARSQRSDSHGRAKALQSIDIFFITAVSAGHDLSGVKIEDVSGKAAIDVADELARRSSAMKQGQIATSRCSKRLMDALPQWLLRRALRATAFLTEDRARRSVARPPPCPVRQRDGDERRHVRPAQGFAPLAWMYDVPVLVLVGEIVSRAVVVGDRVEPRASADHGDDRPPLRRWLARQQRDEGVPRVPRRAERFEPARQPSTRLRKSCAKPPPMT
jgi:hypothetical protein